MQNVGLAWFLPQPVNARAAAVAAATIAFSAFFSPFIISSIPDYHPIALSPQPIPGKGFC